MEHLSLKRKIYIMIAVMAAMFFSAVNQTIVGTALPRIIAELDGIDYYTWVITMYLLTSTISTILVGKLSDIYGRKPFILCGIVLFMIGAFMCGTSADIFQLIAYRGVQGLGAGVIMATAFTAIGDLFSPRERGRWSGIMMSVFGVSSIIGPTLGGYIVDHWAWHWVFWIFLPLGFVALAMIMALYPKTEKTPGEPIDYAGSLLLTLTIVPMLLAFSWAGVKYAWDSPQIIGLFAAAFVSLGLLLLVESKVKSPVLPLRQFRIGIVAVANTVSFILNAGMMGALIYIPFFVQGVEGVSPTYSGYITMPMTLGMVLMSAICGQIITKTGKYKKLALIGIAIMALGMVMMTLMNSVLVAVLSMIVFGFGLGMALPIFSLVVQNAVPPRDLGAATATTQLFRSLGGTIGIAVMGTVMTSGIKIKMKQDMANVDAAELAQLDPKLLQAVDGLQNPQILLDQPKLKQFLASLPAGVHDIFVKAVDALRDSVAYGLSEVFLTGTITIVVAFLLTFFLKEVTLRTSNKDNTRHYGEDGRQMRLNLTRAEKN
ncbi:MAG TPA: MDR family MFS transporter [Bacilli bacterium]